ncbi:response regulator, partial [Escherichia coli]|uniref:response regulator n=1 Tax=Escherichia coli TaxID=562 RepID=UPI001FCF2075
MKPTSVIIMDTHPIIRMSIEVLLQKNSELQIVLKTDDYRITIDYLRTRPVDLIIMDIDLPGTDGFTFLKRIKQIQSTVKVLFLSSKSECFYAGRAWICPYISRHLLSLNPLQARCRRYSRG